MTALRIDNLSSPIGDLLVATHGAALCVLAFEEHREAALERLRERFGDLALAKGADPSDAAARVRGYLDGDLDALEAIDVDAGGTPFQRRVWKALREIPRGGTASYGDIAASIGQPGAARAVGGANNRNPIAIVIPCHRVVAGGGRIGGYGGGLERKQWLLRHERALLS